MQRIFEYGDIQNTSRTPDKELNILIYWTPFYVIVYGSYTLFKTVRFLAHLYFVDLCNLSRN